MTNIELKQLKLNYFKGAKNLEIDFNHVTTVFGKNASGKSTIQDAFTWLLFGKNTAGESDTKFNIKTLDENNKVIPKVEHSIEGLLLVGNEEIRIKRVLREKWQKPKGALEAVFKGNETVYYWNNVPKTQREYQAKISEILDETVFKMITDPLAFNNLHWEKQRELLISIAGSIENSDVANTNDDFKALMDKLTNKSLEEYVKELAAERLRLNKEIKYIPTRIDEVIKGKPESVDFSAYEKEKAELEKKIAEIQSNIDDRNKAIDNASKKRTEISNKIFELKSRNQNIEFEEKQKINSIPKDDPLGELPSKLEKAKNDLERYEKLQESLKHELSMDEEEFKNVSVKVIQLRQDWEKENATQLKFDDDSFVCPGCKRPLESDDIEAEKAKMVKEFNADKQNELKRIHDSGIKVAEREKMLKEQIEKCNNRIKDGEKIIDKTKKEVESISKEIEAIKAKPVDIGFDPAVELEKALKSNDEYQKNIKDISELESKLKGETGFDASDLIAQRDAINAEVKEIDSVLSNKTRIEEADNRIKELAKEEETLAKEIAKIEQMQYVSQEFTTAKINMLEDNINKLFNGVKFKMFKEQVDGVIPWCFCLVQGVPFSDANTAGQINAGLEIINVLSKHYNVTAPVFIDNRESVTDIIATEAQIINLIVSPEDKTLRIV